MTRIIRELCQQLWETKLWPKSWTISLVIIIPKKVNLKTCSNYRTHSLISYPRKTLLIYYTEQINTTGGNNPCR